jgi:CubicO group peptidase (beta-lactamase class C family)
MIHRPVILTLCAALLALPLPAQGFRAVDVAVQQGITKGIYPGAVVVVGRADTILYSKGYGRFTWSRASNIPDPATSLWDLASVSKVVGTTTAAAVLVDEGRLNLDAPVSTYVPEFIGTGKELVTVRMLLDHTSGLPPYAPLWREATNTPDALRKLFLVPLSRHPGASPLYSDLNAMLAGLVVEKVSGERLDAFADSAVFQPLGMLTTRYRTAASDRTHVVPTSTFKGRPVAGVVNDQNAQVLGGVAGHAGIFSTGIDLAHFAQGWLRDSTRASAPWLAPATLARFFERTATSGTRALGWDTPPERSDTGISAYGHCATSSTIGHTGWTGTVLWLDRSQDLFVIFLTNRSYAPRTPKQSFAQLKLVRSNVSDAVRSALGSCG